MYYRKELLAKKIRAGCCRAAASYMNSISHELNVKFSVLSDHFEFLSLINRNDFFHHVYVFKRFWTNQAKKQERVSGPKLPFSGHLSNL